MFFSFFYVLLGGRVFACFRLRPTEGLRKGIAQVLPGRWVSPVVGSGNLALKNKAPAERALPGKVGTG